MKRNSLAIDPSHFDMHLDDTSNHKYNAKRSSHISNKLFETDSVKSPYDSEQMINIYNKMNEKDFSEWSSRLFTNKTVVTGHSHIDFVGFKGNFLEKPKFITK